MPTPRPAERPAHAPSAPRRAPSLVAALLAIAATTWQTVGTPPAAQAISPTRMTPAIEAIRAAAPAVVNIQGQKAVTDPPANGRGGGVTRQVNGMGTGIVIDPRGFILTNHHVVDGVRQINVTLDGGQAYVATMVARDSETDLAVIRIRTPQMLPVVRLGTSSDLLTGETVVAVGNAFGYEHTATSGIISALHRNVQVNETQQYLDLIQTDASINPGNSGGPLLNIDGEMIGVNVAVRAGAQGIGFAIPIDKALDVATRLMSVERLENHWHGITPLAVEGPAGPVSVGRIDRGSPAEECGLQPGDVLRQIGTVAIRRPLDVERAILGRQAGEAVSVTVRRDGQDVDLDLRVAAKGGRGATGARGSAEAAPSNTAVASATAKPSGEFQTATWDAFGLILRPAAKNGLKELGLPIEDGMEVVAVKPASPAAEQGVAAGDVLIQIHRWYTDGEQDVRYILSRRDSIANLGPVRFDIVRGGERFFGQLALTPAEAVRR